jgi:hypothetical protein
MIKEKLYFPVILKESYGQTGVQATIDHDWWPDGYLIRSFFQNDIMKRRRF